MSLFHKDPEPKDEHERVESTEEPAYEVCPNIEDDGVHLEPIEKPEPFWWLEKSSYPDLSEDIWK